MSTNMELAIEFANKVRAELRHLTSEEIADLTDGLEADIASSLDDGADIGTAEKYASDLLAAAGLSNVKNSRSGALTKALKDLTVKIRPLVTSISDLAPAWWVFRAWVATQLIGFYFHRDYTGSPAAYEWSRHPLRGIFVFFVLMAISVRVGRKSRHQHLKPALLLSHIALGLGAIMIMFSPPRKLDWVVYSSDGSYPTTTIDPNYGPCTLSQVPNVVGMSATKAQKFLGGEFRYSYFDKNTSQPINPTPEDIDDPIIVDQFPVPGNEICAEKQSLQLWAVMKSTSHMGPYSTSTQPTRVLGTSTTIATTTTVKPRATTTTAP